MRYKTRGENPKFTSTDLFSEIKERYAKFGDTSFETYKFVFDDMIKEAGADVLFHATMFDTIIENRTVKGVKIATKGGDLEAFADFFIDASGDGDKMRADFIKNVQNTH